MGRFPDPLARVRLVAAAGIVVCLAVGCSIDLGTAPFKCSNAGQCPDGYECNPANLCVKTGTCPSELPGCGGSEDKCGDGKCADKETCESCEKDCGSCSEPNCGDGECNGDETCSSCEKDCGKCATEGCGNGKCDGNETCETCEADCGKCSAGCGNGTCDGTETCETCEADCGKCDTCGNDTCDAGETSLTCPADCEETPECQADSTQCKDEKNLTFCEDGKWKTDSCDNICLAGGFDYSVGCEMSTQAGKEICLCGDYAQFGEICDDQIQCAADLFCGAFGDSATAGFCTRYCDNYGGTCAGAPLGTDAQCILTVNNQDACGFVCGLFTSCPTGMYCDLDDLCKPQ